MLAKERADWADGFRESDLLTAIVEGSLDPIAAIDLNLDYIACNTAYVETFERLFGRRVGTGVNLRDALAHLPEEQATVEQLWARAFRGERFELEHPFGDPARERNVFHISVHPIRGAGGRVIGAAHIARDVTARRRAEEELRRLAADLEARVAERTETLERALAAQERIVTNSLDMICLVESSGVFRYVSGRSEPLLGYRPAEMIGRHYSEFIHPDDVECSTGAARAIQAGGDAHYFENRYLHKDGRAVHLLWTGTWSETENMLYSSAHDVTERVEAEAAMRQAIRLKAVADMTGGIAHDFNNLLSVVVGNAEMLSDRLEDPADRALIAAITAAAERGAGLVARLLAFARRQPLQPERVDTDGLIRSVDALLGSSLGERVEVVLDCAPDAWPVLADATQLEAALINLALNARDAMAEGGRLVIETRNRRLERDAPDVAAGELNAGDYLAISVADTGTGMSPEVAARVFEPFFTTKEVGRGTGLGLSMVWGFGKQSGGHVRLSTARGVGTTVELLLPRWTPPV